MDKNYRLTSEEYARLLGISTEALRSRRRRGKYKNYIQDDNGNYWWENDRPYQDNTIFNDRPQRVRNGLVRLPGPRRLIEESEEEVCWQRVNKLITTMQEMDGS